MNERPNDRADEVGGYPNIECFRLHGPMFGSILTILYDFHYGLVLLGAPVPGTQTSITFGL